MAMAVERHASACMGGRGEGRGREKGGGWEGGGKREGEGRREGGGREEVIGIPLIRTSLYTCT